jgi:hypothetical protein
LYRLFCIGRRRVSDRASAPASADALGNVAVSRHAQSQMLDAGISQEAFDRALLDPTQPDAPDGEDILWRERDGLRVVILTNPRPNRGAKLVKTPLRMR